MLNYPDINPIAFSLGPLAVHWYGLMYLIGFLAGWGLLSFRARKNSRGFTSNQLSDVVFFAAIGAILGGRIGYVLFYDFEYFIANPIFLFQTWKGGMSFHGGLLGVMIALWICSNKLKKTFLELTDLIIPVVPIGLGAGRIGNFINGELWGRVTDLPWGMVFPQAGGLARHPSQLYEFLLEGVVLFLILWFFSMRDRPRGAISGLFLLLYGLFRFTIEFFREPDFQQGFVAFNWLTKGQLLSIPMIVFGMILLIFAYFHCGKKTCSNI